MESRILTQVKLDFIINNVTLISRCAGKKWLFWFCEGSACVSGKTKCAICVLAYFVCSFAFAVRSNRLAPNGPAIKQVAEGNLPEGRSDRRERSFIACWALLNGA
jgi:hypothetical protein